MAFLNTIVSAGFLIYFGINRVRNRIGRVINKISLSMIHILPTEKAQKVGLLAIKYGLYPECNRPVNMLEFLQGTVLGAEMLEAHSKREDS